MFELPHIAHHTSALHASQSMVPGEPVFVLVRDDTSDARTSTAISVVTLTWVRREMHDILNGETDTSDWRESYVMLPDDDRLIRCGIGTTAGQRGEGDRLIITAHAGGVLWTGEL